MDRTEASGPRPGDGSCEIVTARNPAAQRHDQLARWLESEGRVDVVEAATRLGVAPETVRRDLRSMESDGRLHRVHGGAIPVLTQPTAGPSPLDSSRYAELGRLLWGRLPRNGTLLIGSGAPALGLAEAIATDPPARDGLTIVTTFLDAAIVLSRTPNLAVYNIGGAVSPNSHGQEGDWAITELNRLRVEVSAVCPDGLSVADGLSSRSPGSAAVCRAEVLAGKRVIAVADAAAVGISAFVQFATIDEIDEVAIAGDPAESALRPLVDRGVPLTIAHEPG